MICNKCSKTAVLETPKLCSKHFLINFENKVSKEIKNQEISGKVCVAVSGGKDSITTLFLLKKAGIDVTGLAVDEGIKGYRDESLEFLKRFCKKEGVSLKIVSFFKEFGKTLDEIVKVKKHSCSYCGVLRRSLLNKYASSFDMVATGHNLDDESQAALMNILFARTELFPKNVKQVKGLIRRVKPLIYCSEKEVMTYAFLKGLIGDFNECPNMKNSQREVIRDLLNKLELSNSNVKKNILKKYEKIRVGYEGGGVCKLCGTPTRNKICNACKMIEEIK